MILKKENIERQRRQKFQQRKQQNQRIITLIRSKLRPLRKSEDSGFPSINEKISPRKQSGKQNPKKNTVHQLVIQSTQTYQIPKHPLIERAQSFIQEKRKMGSQYFQNDDKSDKIPKINIEKYLQLFQKKQEKKDDLSEMKKELLDLGIDKASFLTDLGDNIDEKYLSEEQATLMNAKIRQKLNHRKIIQMYKNK